MPANLSPEYKSAQEEYRRARDPKERLECLREMLRTIPRHKGTEHLQADIRTRIKELTEEVAGPRKGGARGGPSVVVRPEGAGQVALLGPPNVGKSSLHSRLTGSHAAVGPYPLTTRLPLPGMLPHQDVQLQIVDLPPVSAEFMEPWMPNALQSSDGALLVVDLGAADCVGEVAALRERLEEKGVSLLSPARPAAIPSTGPGAGPAGEEEALADPFRIRLPTLLLANKADRLGDPQGELEVFRQLAGLSFPSITVSAKTGQGLAQVGPLLFAMLGVVRVYTKVPGHPPAQDRPFTLRGGATVRDVAFLVHRGRAADLKFARLWGSGKFDGEQVSAEHPLRDGDVVELHW